MKRSLGRGGHDTAEREIERESMCIFDPIKFAKVMTSFDIPPGQQLAPTAGASLFVLSASSIYFAAVAAAARVFMAIIVIRYALRDAGEVIQPPRPIAHD